MKKYLSQFLFAALLLLGGISCAKEEEVAAELTVAVSELSFASETGSAKLALKSNVAWTAESSQVWCTLSQTSGEAGTKQLTVSVTENNASAKREAVITISAGSETRRVAVTQELKMVLQVGKNEYEVNGSTSEITVTLNAVPPDYTVATMVDWIKPKSSSADKKTLVFTISENKSVFARQGVIRFALQNLTQDVTVKQDAQNPSVPADNTGMADDAMTLARKITLGWNLGNALEAIGGETAWGNPKTTKALIDVVKAAGFNAVRIPCAWDGYIEDKETFRVRDSWFARVKEVVDYCVGNQMYAILNIHWDGGWLQDNPMYAKQAEVNKKQKALWMQIAYYFRDYDERLLFAGTNEVHADYNKPTAENIAVQQSFNQTFVDAVRFTGGKNAYRNLIVQSYNTNIDYAADYLTLPGDAHPNRLMAEVHYYDPWDFAGQEDSKIYLWGTPYKTYGSVSSWGQEDYVEAQFLKMKNKFVNKGIPVILGEYGAIRRTSLSGNALDYHLNSRAYYLKYTTATAKNNGAVPFYWDNGAKGDKGFGLFDRNANMINDQKALDALREGAQEGRYP